MWFKTDHISYNAGVSAYLGVANEKGASGTLIPLEHNAFTWVTQAETAEYEFCYADAKMLRDN